MNKRFLSTLLFGALFIASTSVFVSCKDYDDDIKNLQTQIDKAALKSDLDALQTTLTNAATNSEAAVKKLEAQLAEAIKNSNATAEDLQKQIDAAKAAADQTAKELTAKIKEAADAAAAAQAAAAAAQNAAENAQQSAEEAAKQAAELAKAAQEAADKALQEAIAKLNAENASMSAELKALINQLAVNQQSYVTADDLKAQIEELKASLAHNDGAGAATEAYEAAIAELYKAVTSVELIESYTGYKYIGDNNSWSRTNGWYLNSPLVV